jgi:hypothetical protein
VTTLPKFRILVGAVFGVSIFLALRPPIARAQTDMFIYPAKGQNQAQQDKDRAIPGRYNKRNSTQVSRRAQTPSPLNSVRRRPLPFYKEPLEAPRSERLAERLRVTRAKALPLGQQWGAWLAGSAVGTKKCDKLTLELMRRRRPILGDRHTCAQCRPVCRGAAIPLIDA